MSSKVKEFLFRNTSIRQTVAKNTFWLAVSNVGGRLLRAIIIIYAARVLGAADWGIFSYALSIVAILTIFTDFGIGPLIIRETSRLRENPAARQQLISTAFWIKLLLFVLGAIAVMLAAPVFPIGNQVKLLLPYMLFIFAFDNFREFGFAIIRAMEKMEWEAGLYLLTNVAIVLFGFVFLALAPSAESFAGAYAAGTAIGALATIVAMREHLAGAFSKASWTTLRHLLSSGWPFAVSAILGSLLINTDVLVIGWLRSARDVGLYSAGDRIVQVLYLLPAIVSTSTLPTFARFASAGLEKMRRAIESVVSLVYVFALPMAVGGAILGTRIIAMVFGSSYLGAGPAFQVLILTILANFPATILSGVVFSYNKQRSLIIYPAIAGISNVIFDFLFIPRFGIVGSSFATLFAQILGNIYLWRIAKKEVPFAIFKHLKKSILAAAVMAAFLLLFWQLNILLLISAGAAVYFATLFLLKEKLFWEVAPILRPFASTVPEADESVAL